MQSAVAAGPIRSDTASVVGSMTGSSFKLESGSDAHLDAGTDSVLDTAAFSTIGGDVLLEALLKASGAFVLVADRRGDILSDNGSLARWFGMRAASPGGDALERSAAAVFLDEQAGVRNTVVAGEHGTFRGIWRGLLIEARVLPQGDRSLVVVHPCVVSGSRTTSSTHPLSGESTLDQLTANEREVLELIGLGLKTKDIARIVQRSEKTVEARRSSIGRKLELETRGELVRVAVRTGLSEL
ncbi:MAG: helix-turn-helix transcriptional regulator [Planctomycetota bacterium]